MCQILDANWRWLAICWRTFWISSVRINKLEAPIYIHNFFLCRHANKFEEQAKIRAAHNYWHLIDIREGRTTTKSTIFGWTNDLKMDLIRSYLPEVSNRLGSNTRKFETKCSGNWFECASHSQYLCFLLQLWALTSCFSLHEQKFMQSEYFSVIDKITGIKTSQDVCLS